MRSVTIQHKNEESHVHIRNEKEKITWFDQLVYNQGRATMLGSYSYLVIRVRRSAICKINTN